jgi:lauroyl/myristoyl acyltransferase
MTVLPQPKAPGIAVVPPCTHLHTKDNSFSESNLQIHTEIMNLIHVDLLAMDDLQQVFQRLVAFVEQAIFEALYVWFFLHRIQFLG